MSQSRNKTNAKKTIFSSLSDNTYPNSSRKTHLETKQKKKISWKQHAEIPMPQKQQQQQRRQCSTKDIKVDMRGSTKKAEIGQKDDAV